jgi:L,D-peptidoglycan transpeptidase YkuD (ErfK/YbiS/YcfS/YnhG family)
MIQCQFPSLLIDRSTVHIRSTNNGASTGIIEFSHNFMPCIFGRSGIRPRKIEGDGVTPAGCYDILYGFYRPDRVRHISSKIRLLPIKPDYGWCDDPDSPQYNRFVQLPVRCSHEKLWRHDHLYDICLVLDHNMHPRKRNGGSAIFFHLLHPDNQPTQGCIAISENNMRKFLGQCMAQTRMVIHA